MLEVKKGLENKFEADFKKASKYISSIDGYLNHKLKRCLEQRNKYILLVEWHRLEDTQLVLDNLSNMPIGEKFYTTIMTPNLLLSTMKRLLK
jgi:predicted AAA+ superfamily ATPase